MANPDGQSFLDFGNEVAHSDSLDVCDRCRNTPWIDGLKGWKIVQRESLSTTCPICNLLLSRDCEISDIRSSLTWKASDETSSIFRPRLKGSTGSQVLLRQPYQNLSKYAEHLIWVSAMSEGITKSNYEYCDPPTISFSQVREHIDICLKVHKSCGLEYFRPLENLRVIDCEQRLVVNAPTDCKYVALSYVWGKLASSEDFVLSHSLPPTIEHSILTTLKLGYRYLWIDRYVS